MERREECRKEWPVHCTACTTRPSNTTTAKDLAVILAKFGQETPIRIEANQTDGVPARFSVGDTFYWRHFSGILGPAIVLDINMGPDEVVWVLTEYRHAWRWVKETVILAQPPLATETEIE